ncbi:putative DNA-binding transcriptional regulator AlpA [Rhizobium sp. BK316]|nr:putative DNA-binding transcriptional regulator AlpA [Rhizobium sp. BK316]
MAEADEFLTASQICKERKFSKVTLYSLIRRGLLPTGERVGIRAVRWRRSVLEEAFQKLNSEKAPEANA